MKKLSTLSFIVVLTQIVSCSKDTQPAATVSTAAKTTIEITVRDGRSWAQGKVDTTLNIVSNATVKLYVSKDDIINNVPPAFTLITDASGKASLDIDHPSSAASTYYFTAEKGTEKNVVNNWLVKSIYTFSDPSGLLKGPSIARQTPAPIAGSPLFLDANNDGIIQSPGDDVYSDFVIISVNKTVSKNSIIF
jgi:hypothetical protein